MHISFVLNFFFHYFSHTDNILVVEMKMIINLYLKKITFTFLFYLIKNWNMLTYDLNHMLRNQKVDTCYNARIFIWIFLY
jgi:hypothetical protein